MRGALGSNPSESIWSEMQAHKNNKAKAAHIFLCRYVFYAHLLSCSALLLMPPQHRSSSHKCLRSNQKQEMQADGTAAVELSTRFCFRMSTQAGQRRQDRKPNTSSKTRSQTNKQSTRAFPVLHCACRQQSCWSIDIRHAVANAGPSGTRSVSQGTDCIDRRE